MLYWYLITLFQQQQKSIFDFQYIELIVGVLVGLTPTIIKAVQDKIRWKSEKEVVESEATENIANAASVAANTIVEYSQNLATKTGDLIAVYETALERQTEMYESERNLRITQEKQHTEEIQKYDLEIKELKKEITQMNEMVLICSKELYTLVIDIKDGNDIEAERLRKLEAHWDKQ